MRAIVVDGFGPPERLRVGEVAEPVPGPDEVLVMVHAVPVNYVDLLVVGGSYQFLPRLPFIPGKGPAGVVTALGREVTSLRAGDRVLATAEQGGYAEAVTVRADHCYRLPPSMSFTEAASLSLVYDTAWFALRERARVETGEIVLVLGGSGGGGHAAVQLAHYLLLKNIEISGLQIRDYRKRRPAQVAACFAEVFRLYEHGRVKPAAATTFPLARAGEALAALLAVPFYSSEITERVSDRSRGAVLRPNWFCPDVKQHRTGTLRQFGISV